MRTLSAPMGPLFHGMPRPAAALLTLAVALAGCNGGDTDDDDDTDSGDTDGGGDDDGLGLTVEASGDHSCFTPTDSFDATTWLTQSGVLASANVTVDGVVSDFEDDVTVARRDISLWFDDDATGAPDATGAVGDNASGEVSIAGVPSCQPVSYLSAEEAGLGEAKATYKAHQIYGPGSGGTTTGEYQSVSNDTYGVIPTIFGIDLDPTKGVIAGTAYDCTRDPETSSDIDAGKIVGAKVRVTDLNGNVQDDIVGRYFVDNFPTKNQPHTSADGLWGVFNVPEGTWRIELWGLVGGDEVLLGATTAKVYPDSINIANIFSGYGDGVKYPATCLGDGGGDTDDTDDTDTDT